MACPEGIEPPTTCLEGRCSIQLSYGQKACEAILKGCRVGIRRQALSGLPESGIGAAGGVWGIHKEYDMNDQTPADNIRPASPHRSATNEEPEITNEESVPSDGKDPEGEDMIDELGKSDAGKKLDQVAPAPGAEPMPEQLPVS
jgi:hypothetical protein